MAAEVLRPDPPILVGVVGTADDAERMVGSAAGVRVDVTVPETGVVGSGDARDLFGSAEAVLVPWGTDGVRRVSTVASALSSVTVPLIAVGGPEVAMAAALMAGADRYLVGPVDRTRLRAVVVAHERRLAQASLSADRPGWLRSGRVTLGRLAVDWDHWRAEVDGRRVEVGPMRFRTLAYLASRRGHGPVRREELEAAVWGEGSILTPNALDRAIADLRAALRAAGVADGIVTEARVGYRLEPSAFGA